MTKTPPSFALTSYPSQLTLPKQTAQLEAAQRNAERLRAALARLDAGAAPANCADAHALLCDALQREGAHLPAALLHNVAGALEAMTSYLQGGARGPAVLVWGNCPGRNVELRRDETWGAGAGRGCALSSHVMKVGPRLLLAKLGSLGLGTGCAVWGAGWDAGWGVGWARAGAGPRGGGNRAVVRFTLFAKCPPPTPTSGV